MPILARWDDKRDALTPAHAHKSGVWRYDETSSSEEYPIWIYPYAIFKGVVGQ